VLHVPSDASADDIKAAYRSMIQQYHPDKVATLGKDLRDLAEIKTKAITVAYEQALRDRRIAPYKR